MRQYPRSLCKGKDDRITVHNELSEYEAGLNGYESHWNPEINKKRKGTDRDVLREKPEVEEDVEMDKVPLEKQVLQEAQKGMFETSKEKVKKRPAKRKPKQSEV